MNAPPINLLRLSFSSHAEFVSYFNAYHEQLKQIWLWHETLGNQENELRLAGICDLCAQGTVFTAQPHKSEDDRFPYRVNWWGSAQCERCGMTNLDRVVIRTLLDGAIGRLYHVGQHSPFADWLRRRRFDLTTSQYQEGREPGETENGVRYEDLTALSFGDATFDSVICMEVLEHIPDYIRALTETARVLRPGGRALLTFPWLGTTTYEHLTRAEMLPDGSIRHILPPEYHGDPASRDGILSFRSFGWKILDELRACGFSDAFAQFVFGPLHGYMILLNPIIVGIR